MTRCFLFIMCFLCFSFLSKSSFAHKSPFAGSPVQPRKRAFWTLPRTGQKGVSPGTHVYVLLERAHLLKQGMSFRLQNAETNKQVQGRLEKSPLADGYNVWVFVPDEPLQSGANYQLLFSENITMFVDIASPIQFQVKEAVLPTKSVVPAFEYRIEQVSTVHYNHYVNSKNSHDELQNKLLFVYEMQAKGRKELLSVHLAEDTHQEHGGVVFPMESKEKVSNTCLSLELVSMRGVSVGKESKCITTEVKIEDDSSFHDGDKDQHGNGLQCSLGHHGLQHPSSYSFLFFFNILWLLFLFFGKKKKARSS